MKKKEKKEKKERKGFFKEFKEFISRGNVFDMAVGIIVGGAFTAIVNALCNNVLKPIVNWFLALILGTDSLEGVYTFLKTAYVADELGNPTTVIDIANSIFIDWGSLINAIINFLLIALILFLIIKVINKVHQMSIAAKENMEEAAQKRREEKEAMEAEEHARLSAENSAEAPAMNHNESAASAAEKSDSETPPAEK